MRKYVYNNRIIKLYDNIEELPVLRFQKYNKFLLLDSAIGSDINDLNMRVEKAIRYISIDAESAVTELRNLQQAIHVINSELSPNNLAFAALIYSIDGKVLTGDTDDVFKDALKELRDVPQSFINRLLQSIKKKIDEQLEVYFPSIVNTASEKQFYDLLITRARLQLAQIGGRADNTGKINTIEQEMLLQNKPRKFEEGYNSEVEFDKEFNKSIVLIKDQLQADARSFSVMEYYNALEYLKSKNKK